MTGSDDLRIRFAAHATADLVTEPRAHASSASGAVLGSNLRIAGRWAELFWAFLSIGSGEAADQMGSRAGPGRRKDNFPARRQARCFLLPSKEETGNTGSHLVRPPSPGTESYRR